MRSGHWIAAHTSGLTATVQVEVDAGRQWSSAYVGGHLRAATADPAAGAGLLRTPSILVPPPSVIELRSAAAAAAGSRLPVEPPPPLLPLPCRTGNSHRQSWSAAARQPPTRRRTGPGRRRGPPIFPGASLSHRAPPLPAVLVAESFLPTVPPIVSFLSQ